ncbi:MAG: hypothetical protein HOY76_12565, partial [Streptomyces sp.]|nr:hypothetical protein [Streptomyces sp.]
GRTARRVVLLDAAGHRVELDAHLLAENPLLRHELDRGVRRSLAAGLLADASAVRALVAAADAEEARELLQDAGLD